MLVLFIFLPFHSISCYLDYIGISPYYDGKNGFINIPKQLCDTVVV